MNIKKENKKTAKNGEKKAEINYVLLVEGVTQILVVKYGEFMLCNSVN